MKGTHESLIMDALYITQELFEGITYQESLMGILLLVSLLKTIV
jgi:hypothetical protein